MQKTTVNPNPEQEMTVNPFAQEQAAETQPQENAQTYPVEVDGDIVELTLDCRTERRTGSARDEPEEPPCGGRSGAVGRGTHGSGSGYARFARQVTFSSLHDLTFM